MLRLLGQEGASGLKRATKEGGGGTRETQRGKRFVGISQGWKWKLTVESALQTPLLGVVLRLAIIFCCELVIELFLG